MPKSYPALLAAIVAAGGWYFTKGPGAGQLPQLINSITHSQTTGGPNQYGQQPSYPQTPSYNGSYNGSAPQQSAPPVPANYASYGNQPAAPLTPATPPPNPMNGGPAIRIATFNIQVFGEKKASKPYVMATLASIIRLKR